MIDIHKFIKRLRNDISKNQADQYERGKELLAKGYEQVAKNTYSKGNHTIVVGGKSPLSKNFKSSGK